MKTITIEQTIKKIDKIKKALLKQIETDKEIISIFDNFISEKEEQK